MLIVFIGLALGAFIGLAILLAMGFDHEFDLGAEGDVDVGHEVSTEGGAESGHELTGEAGPSMLSVRLLLFFILGFGIFGILAMKAFNWTSGIAILIASVGAFICYFIAYMILKLLWKQQVTTQFTIDSVVNCDAMVTQKIPTGGIGEIKVRCPNTGLDKYVSAQASDPKHVFEKGEVVIVKSVVASTCIVEKKKNK